MLPLSLALLQSTGSHDWALSLSLSLALSSPLPSRHTGAGPLTQLIFSPQLFSPSFVPYSLSFFSLSLSWHGKTPVHSLLVPGPRAKLGPRSGQLKASTRERERERERERSVRPVRSWFEEQLNL